MRLDGTARIACVTPIAPILLPTILTHVRKQHPNLTIEVMGVSTYEMPTAIDGGEADFALCYGPVDWHQHRFAPLFQAPPHVALPADHALASGRFVTLEQLEPEPLVVLDLEHSRKYLLDLFASRGLKPNVVY
ncbi:LysR substrate-binding domain-containing protein, partial [Paracoccus sp. (in: a-proteobacteria)]|nr:LysR substrate-binding domain-containing protein [Paracoccus sp. (in: a-proteobacteria)]